MMLGWTAAALAADCGPAPLVVAEPLGAGIDGDCAFVDIEAAGRLYREVPTVGVSGGVQLARARTELGLRVRDVQVRMAGTVARSGGEQGYVGIEGESYVPVVQIAEVRYDLPTLGLAVAAGLTDDPWVMTIEPAWAHPETLLPLATDQRYLDRSDTGGFLSWTSPRALVSATVAVTSGEGAARRERNDGVNVTGVVHVRPSGPEPTDVTPEIALFARAGSRGIGAAPDHRAGGAVIVRHPRIVGAAEVVVGWGLESDPSRRPLGVSGWVRTGDEAPFVALGRLDVARDDRSSADAEETLMLLAGGIRLPWSDGPLSAVVGWERRRYGVDARPVAGGASLAASDTGFVQLSARIGRIAPFGSEP